ncbi:HsdM family class I SAM-dependent methyltransferase [Desulfonauticus submarinus]
MNVQQNVQQLIKKQGWTETKEKEDDIFVYEFDRDIDTLKIFLTETTHSNRIGELKNKLWNTYYSRVLIYKQGNNQYKIWTNNQSPMAVGHDFDSKSFNEKISPVEYWNEFIIKTPKDTVDKKLEKSILTVFKELNHKYSNKDDLISIILTCTFIRFLEDKNLSDVSIRLIDALSSKEDTINLFKKYNALHNGMLFKQDTLYALDDDTCRILKNFLEANLFGQRSLFRFDFKYIPIELISNIYEKLLTEKLGDKEKRNRGVAYTPPKLANYLVKEAFKEIDQKFNKSDLPRIKIGDLSAGSGIFLVLSFRELLKRINKKMSFEDKKKILEESFYGIDLDESAINITTFSLYIELLEYEKNKKLSSNDKFPILKNNIKAQDALFYSEQNFDLIIGNPPWGSKPEYFKKIKNRSFAKNIANKESAQIFVNIAIEKLKDGGTLALVLPSASFYNSRSFNFRNSLMRNTIIKEFVDFSPIRSYVFKNHVETCVIIGEKKKKAPYSYLIPLRRVINEADYLYFNHVSGNTNNIDSNFLQSRNDSWQIAIRGGNLAVLFIKRLSDKNNNFITLKESKDIFIGTGYQAKKTGANVTISEIYSMQFKKTIYLIEKGEIVQKYTNLKKSGKSHILFNKRFYNDSLGIANSYKYEKGLIIKYFKAGNRVISGDFNIITGNQKALYFILALLKSRLGEFLISIGGAKTSLLSNEIKDPKVFKEDIEKLFVPDDYINCSNIIEIGKKIAREKKYLDIKKNQKDLDNKIEKIYKLNILEKRMLDQWEKITGRKKMDSHNTRIKSYQSGFEYVLDNYNLPKPKKWGRPEIINGVEIIPFSGTGNLPTINEKIKQKIKDIITAKKDIHFEFINDNQGIIVRREKSNYGFLTGLFDAELILSNL